MQMQSRMLAAYFLFYRTIFLLSDTLSSIFLTLQTITNYRQARRARSGKADAMFQQNETIGTCSAQLS
jgi:hypothetical protein